MNRPKIDVEQMKLYVNKVIEGLSTEKALEELNKEIDGLVMLGSLDAIIAANYMRSLIIYAHFKSRGPSPMTVDEYLGYLTDKQLAEEPSWITKSVKKTLTRKMSNSDYAEAARLHEIVHTYNEIDTIRRKLIRQRAEDIVDYLHSEGKVSEPNHAIRELFIARNYEDAERIARGSDEKALTLLASMYRAWDKNLLKAEIFFREAISINPEYTPAYVGLVGVLMKSRKHSEALQYIDGAPKTSGFVKFKSKFDDYKRDAELIVSNDK